MHPFFSFDCSQVASSASIVGPRPLSLSRVGAFKIMPKRQKKAEKAKKAKKAEKAKKAKKAEKAEKGLISCEFSQMTPSGRMYCNLFIHWHCLSAGNLFGATDKLGRFVFGAFGAKD